MRLKNNRSGFTLLEIIIVVIIVGVLASLALPRLFKTINYSTSTEALNAFGTIKRGIDRCALAQGADTGVADYTVCNTWDNIGLDDPGLVAGSRFAYAWGGGFPTFRVTATANNGSGTVVMDYDTAAGTVDRSGTGDFSNIN